MLCPRGQSHSSYALCTAGPSQMTPVLQDTVVPSHLARPPGDKFRESLGSGGSFSNDGTLEKTLGKCSPSEENNANT